MARALIVAIEKYDKLPSLTGCLNDARAMREVLATHEDGGTNFTCRLLLSPGKDEITPKRSRKKPGQNDVTRIRLRDAWAQLFDNYDEDILFYFSGHGHSTDAGGYIVTQEAEPGDPGLGMDELLTLASKSRARSVLLILDCCFSGVLGDPTILQGSGRGENPALLREGLTILSASRPMQTAAESGGYGVFTNLIVGALRGGAADVRGRVSAASIYAYVEQTLGAWDQRPVYKSHASMLAPVRQCKAAVPDPLLRELPQIFNEQNDRYSLEPSSRESPGILNKAGGSYRLAPSFEHTHPSADPRHVELFKKFKLLRNARLLSTENDEDLFFVALQSKTIRLTPLGQFYWRLARSKKL